MKYTTTITKSYYICDKCGKKFEEEIQNKNFIGSIEKFFNRFKKDLYEETGKEITKPFLFLETHNAFLRSLELIEEFIDRESLEKTGLEIKFVDRQPKKYLCYDCAKKYDELIREFFDNKEN